MLPPTHTYTCTVHTYSEDIHFYHSPKSLCITSLKNSTVSLHTALLALHSFSTDATHTHTHTPYTHTTQMPLCTRSDERKINDVSEKMEDGTECRKISLGDVSLPTSVSWTVNASRNIRWTNLQKETLPSLQTCCYGKVPHTFIWEWHLITANNETIRAILKTKWVVHFWILNHFTLLAFIETLKVH